MKRHHQEGITSLGTTHVNILDELTWEWFLHLSLQTPNHPGVGQISQACLAGPCRPMTVGICVDFCEALVLTNCHPEADVEQANKCRRHAPPPASRSQVRRSFGGFHTACGVSYQVLDLRRGSVWTSEGFHKAISPVGYPCKRACVFSGLV